MIQLSRALSRGFSLVIVIAFLCAAVGCTTTRTDLMQERASSITDPKLDEALLGNVEVMGGLDAWANVDSLSCTAVATIYGSDGGKTLVEQTHEIAPALLVPGESVSVVSVEPAGDLHEVLKPTGYVSYTRIVDGKTIGVGNEAETFGSRIKLFLESKAVGGCATLLDSDVDVRYVELEDKGGRLNHKIEVVGYLLDPSLKKIGDKLEKKADPEQPAPLKDKLVIWVGAKSKQIERMWLRYAVPGEGYGYMAVQVGGYAKGEGLMLPKQLEYVPSDSYQQFSKKHIMTVDFQVWQVVSQENGKQLDLRMERLKQALHLN